MWAVGGGGPFDGGWLNFRSFDGFTVNFSE